MVEYTDIIITIILFLGFFSSYLLVLYSAVVYIFKKFIIVSILNTLLLIPITVGTIFCSMPLLRMHGRYDSSDRVIHIISCLVILAIIYFLFSKALNNIVKYNKNTST